MKIEETFDVLKNLIHADTSYMQNNDALEGWMFINHIALLWYQNIYKLISKNNLTHKFSVKDFMVTLSHIKKININNQWYDAEVTATTQKLLKKLKI
ncbi:MAG TPA: hypothetical protein PKD32_02285 [Saprospiraceae bacterium]|nr:hypothetical protein [Saprospiraceae bacterium]